MSVKKLHLPTMAMDDLFRYIGNHVLKTCGVISKPSVLELVLMRKIANHAKSQLLFLQMITLKVDSACSEFILGMQTACLRYAQPLNNGIFTACEYSLETNPFCQAYEKMAEFRLLQILHLRTPKSV